MVLAETWTAVGSASGGIAAVAALLTVWFARATLREAKDARADAAQQQGELLEAQERAARATEAAHGVELATMEKAHAFELRIGQNRALETLADLIREAADVARGEAVAGIPSIGDVQPMRVSAMPALLLRLQTALASCRSLECPDIPAVSTLAGTPFTPASAPVEFLGLATTALSQLEAVRRGVRVAS